MEKAEFDKFADEYLDLHARSIRASGETPDFFARYKIADVRAETARVPGEREQLKILDFGGGIGTSIPHFRSLFPDAELVCADPSAKSLGIARSRFANAADYVELNSETLPFEDGAFDIVFTACVFHHIDHAEHRRILKELLRVLRPRGRFFLFEHNPFNPLTVRVVNACPYDENACLIGGPRMQRLIRDVGFRTPRLVYRVFFPRMFAVLRPLERFLKWLPLGAQYYVVSTKA